MCGVATLIMVAANATLIVATIVSATEPAKMRKLRYRNVSPLALAVRYRFHGPVA
jgi:hypothetical protein